MPNESDKRTLLTSSLQESRADVQRGLGELTVALVPELDFQLCVERAIAAHALLLGALHKLEASLPDGKVQRVLNPDSRALDQTPIEVAVASSDCPWQVAAILGALKGISNGEKNVWDEARYQGIRPLVVDGSPLRFLADFARFSESDFYQIDRVGEVTAKKIADYLGKKGVVLRAR